ncbi:MAG: hypothetical protein FWC93_01660 [Defluviitaleaceae bacterium]|nr:hypothetical protein [Defluviitaleaceae bacterium]
MKKTTLLLALVLLAVMIFAACSRGGTEWISPMVSFNIDGQRASAWSSQYDLHRNETFEYVFRLNNADVPITPAALIDGGALPATVNLSYDGEGDYLTRIVVFAYNFFDHGRPARIAAHGGEPNPQEILVLWQNPANGHWFNLIQDGIGRTAATMGEHHDDLMSLVRDTPQYTFRLNSETVQDISELDLFIVATTGPTRDDEYTRSGYSLTFAIETPDIDNHFHSWELLAASGTMVIVE